METQKSGGGSGGGGSGGSGGGGGGGGLKQSSGSAHWSNDDKSDTVVVPPTPVVVPPTPVVVPPPSQPVMTDFEVARHQRWTVDVTLWAPPGVPKMKFVAFQLHVTVLTKVTRQEVHTFDRIRRFNDFFEFRQELHRKYPNITVPCDFPTKTVAVYIPSFGTSVVKKRRAGFKEWMNSILSDLQALKYTGDWLWRKNSTDLTCKSLASQRQGRSNQTNEGKSSTAATPQSIAGVDDIDDPWRRQLDYEPLAENLTDEQKEGLVAHGKAEEYLLLVRGGYEGTVKANMLLKNLPIATTSLIFNCK